MKADEKNSGMLFCAIPMEEKRQIEKLAELDGRSVSSWIRIKLRKAMEQELRRLKEEI